MVAQLLCYCSDCSVSYVFSVTSKELFKALIFPFYFTVLWGRIHTVHPLYFHCVLK